VKTLAELPADTEVAWFGKAWDAGCTDEIHIETPENYFCGRCYTEFNAASSGVAAKDADDTWNYYCPGCWGDEIEEAHRRIRDRLGDD
jgi:hypothetical protein